MQASHRVHPERSGSGKKQCTFDPAMRMKNALPMPEGDAPQWLKDAAKNKTVVETMVALFAVLIICAIGGACYCLMKMVQRCCGGSKKASNSNTSTSNAPVDFTAVEDSLGWNK